MNLEPAAPGYAYLGEDAAIDFEHPEIQRVASGLRGEGGDDEGYARAAFTFIRDEISHSVDVQDRRVTWRASDVLAEGVGLCYAQAHLYVALLRAAGIPAGFCYQRLSDDAGGFVLHGLAALELDGEWTRQDPRGLDAQFSLQGEWLAFQVRPELGEIDYPTVFVAPDPAVLAALRGGTDALELCDGGLPSAL